MAKTSGLEDTNFDFVVIGAGIVGTATGYELSKLGKNVALVDQFPLPHTRGSSHGQSRIVRLGYTSTVYGDMMPDAFRCWRDIEKLTQQKLLQESDIIFIDTKPFEINQKVKAVLDRLGIHYEVLSPKQLQEKFPTINLDENFEAILERDAAVAQADRCGSALLQLFKRNGGKLLENEKVLAIKPGDIVQVVTERRTLKARCIVITAGPWAKELLAQIGLDLPLQPISVNVFYWKTEDPRYRLNSKFPMFIYYGKESHLYGLPVFEYPNMLKVCFHSGCPSAPDSRDEPGGKHGLKESSDFIRKYLKGVEHFPRIIEKCMYTETPDTDFVIDYHPSYKNIVIGAGFSGHGFKMAPVTGKILAQLAQGLKPSYDVSSLRIGRFTDLKSKM